ncbi:MAG: D-glycero-beta-D-manno-heptose-7-phosphate kinase [Candidatus Anstonellales archaeon]
MNKLLSHKEALSIISEFEKVTVGVIGDVMLDKYIFGKAKRISPEAPVPIVEVIREKLTPGGAANVSANISALGAKVNLVSVIGDDPSATKLTQLLSLMNNINTEFIINKPQHKTTEKIRIIADHQQVARVDHEVKLEYTHTLRLKIKDNIKKVIENSNIIVLSDYGKGVLSRDVIEFCITYAKKKNIAVFVDPKIEHFISYKGVTSMTPNISEAFGGMRKLENREEKAIEKIGKEIVRKLSLKTLIITRSEEGMSVFDKTSKGIKITHIPTAAKEVFDVTGAGDTVISVAAMAWVVSRDILKSAVIANYAASIVVSKIGSATVTPQELKRIFE